MDRNAAPRPVPFPSPATSSEPTPQITPPPAPRDVFAEFEARFGRDAARDGGWDALPPREAAAWRAKHEAATRANREARYAWLEANGLA